MNRVTGVPNRWFGPQGSKRYHYFGDDLRSLCGKWMLWKDPVSVGIDWGMAIGGGATGDCAECKRRVEKLASA